MGSAIDWLFRNRETGEITIAQFPNLPLWIFLGAVVVRGLAPSGSGTRSAANAVALVGLAWWALDEIARGVNPWRRILGSIGMVFVLLGIVRLVG